MLHKKKKSFTSQHIFKNQPKCSFLKARISRGIKPLFFLFTLIKKMLGFWIVSFFSEKKRLHFSSPKLKKNFKLPNDRKEKKSFQQNKKIEKCSNLLFKKSAKNLSSIFTDNIHFRK